MWIIKHNVREIKLKEQAKRGMSSGNYRLNANFHLMLWEKQLLVHTPALRKYIEMVVR